MLRNINDLWNPQALCDEVDDAALRVNGSRHPEQGGRPCEDRKGLKYPIPDYEIHEAGFVFERHESRI